MAALHPGNGDDLNLAAAWQAASGEAISEIAA
jgi:hypothetical protein